MIVEVRRFKIVVQGSKYVRPAPKFVTTPRKIAGLCTAAALSLALAPSALAAPAGDEYLPKVPQSGAQSSGGSSGSLSGTGTGTGTGTTTLPTGGDKSKPASGEEKSSDQTEKDKKKSEITPVVSSDSGDGGGSSGSILFSPIVLLMVAAVIAAAVGMTLLRRKGDDDDPERPGAPGPEKSGARRESGPRTPDGEIVTGPDTTA